MVIYLFYESYSKIMMITKLHKNTSVISTSCETMSNHVLSRLSAGNGQRFSLSSFTILFLEKSESYKFNSKNMHRNEQSYNSVCNFFSGDQIWIITSFITCLSLMNFRSSTKDSSFWMHLLLFSSE